jgi:hypothetical protein
VGKESVTLGGGINGTRRRARAKIIIKKNVENDWRKTKEES